MAGRPPTRGVAPPDGAAPPRPRHRPERRARRAASLLALPTWLLLLGVYGAPLALGVWLAFRNKDYSSFLPEQYVGLSNFRSQLGSQDFRDAVRTTLVIVVVGVAIQIPVGTGLALLCWRKLRYIRVFRTLLLLPMLLTPVAVALMWRFMFDADVGIIDWALNGVGLGSVNWLGDQTMAVFAVVIVDSWQAIPFVMLLVLAGLLGLPSGPLEAALVDGAGALQRIRYVILPMLRPVLYVVVLIRVIDAFKLFDILFILTRGGPGTATQTLGFLEFNTGFTSLAISQAAAIGIALAIFTLPAYVLWLRATREGTR